MIMEKLKEIYKKATENRNIFIAIIITIIIVVIVILAIIEMTVVSSKTYNAAVELMNKGKYKEAISEFESVNGYKDSWDKITECETALKEIDYNAAVKLMKEEKLSEAKKAFEELGEYKDSADKVSECLFLEQKETLSGIKKGDTVKFGAYEQDNNEDNGKEEIEWIVLDVEDNKALVISKYALDCQRYCNSYGQNGVWVLTWDICSLRDWLNGYFLDTAFSPKHQELIPTVSVSPDENPDFSTDSGRTTYDNVFLLSIAEAEKYFPTPESRECAPTDYAEANGAEITFGGWWLRTPGWYNMSHQQNSLVEYNGYINSVGKFFDFDKVAVRPAMWINLK